MSVRSSGSCFVGLPVEAGDLLARQADQRVAVAQRVIEERERMLPRQRRQPQRQLRQVHGEDVLVHAVQAPLGHQPPRIGQHILVVGHLRRLLVRLPRLHQALGQQAAGLDQERAGSHRRVADLEIEDLLGRRLVTQPLEDRPEASCGRSAAVSDRGV